MFDLRYHIASLMAVFLALGVGVLIGITMVGDEALVKEQKHLIDRLEDDFDFLREQNSLAHKEVVNYKNKIALWERFSRATVPYAIEGRLDGRRLVIVQTSGGNLPEDLVENLEAAGANIISFMNLSSLLQMGQQIPAISHGEENQDELGILASQAVEVAQQICYAIEVEGRCLENEDLVADSSWQSPDAAILIGGTDSKDNFLVDKFDIPLITLLQEQGLLVAGVEESEVPYSYIPYYRRKADIIIDNIDTIPGQVALIWALTGIPGYYGIRPEASALFPDLPL